jgi:predicted nucleotidyltransferase component of viral defense system
MLIATMVGIDTRSTMDMDATIRGIPLTEAALTEAMKEILACPVDDGVKMILKGFENIRDESEYPGIRVSIEAILDKTRQVMKVDITAGDKITPQAVEYSFRLLFENRSISILAYNLETVLAEKLETILSRSTANTRMRDYYDVYILTKLRTQNIDWSIFFQAFRNTAEKRGSYSHLLKTGDDIIEEIERSQVLADLWSRYQQKNSYADDLIWRQVIESVKMLYIKVFDVANNV